MGIIRADFLSLVLGTLLLFFNLFRGQWTNQDRTVFSPLVEFIPTDQLQICANRSP
jgi:hypothetical protein